MRGARSASGCRWRRSTEPPAAEPPGPAGPPAAARRLPALLAVLVVALAVGLRTVDLGRPSLWYDEALEVGRASGTVEAAVFGQPGDQDPPAFALFNRLWLRLGAGLPSDLGDCLFSPLSASLRSAPSPRGGGKVTDAGRDRGSRMDGPSAAICGPAPAPGAGSRAKRGGWGRPAPPGPGHPGHPGHPGEAWLRLPSALAGLAAVALLGAWAARRFGARVGLLAGLLAAAAPVLVHYARELNQYAAFVLLALLAAAAHERLLAHGRRADWLAAGLVAVVGLGTYYGMAFPLGALGLDLARRARPRGPVAWPPLVAYAAVGLVTAAALWWVGLSEHVRIAPVQRRWLGTDLAKEAWYLRDYGWREVLVFFALPFSGGPALWAAGALALVAAAGAVWLWRAGPAGRRVVGLYFAAPLAMTYVASVFGLYPFGHRYALFAAPWYLLAVAAGLDGLLARARWLGLAATAAALGAFLAFAPLEAWPNPWQAVPREEVRPLAARLAPRLRAGDGVYVYAGAVPAFALYGGAIEARLPASVVRGSSFDPEVAAREARAAARGRRRLWLVLSHAGAEVEGALVRAFSPGLAVCERVVAPGAAAVCLAPRPAGPVRQGAAGGVVLGPERPNRPRAAP